MAPAHGKISGSKKWSFMLGRTIKDTLTLKNLGYLILEINIKRFDDIFLTRYPDGSRELLMDSNGNILYEANHDNIGKRLELPIVNSLSSGTEGTLIDTESGQKSLISYITSDSLHPGMPLLSDIYQALERRFQGDRLHPQYDGLAGWFCHPAGCTV